MVLYPRMLGHSIASLLQSTQVFRRVLFRVTELASFQQRMSGIAAVVFRFSADLTASLKPRCCHQHETGLSEFFATG